MAECAHDVLVEIQSLQCVLSNYLRMHCEFVDFPVIGHVGGHVVGSNMGDNRI